MPVSDHTWDTNGQPVEVPAAIRWHADALAVVAFFAGHLPELFTARYRDYREEWEMANREDANGGSLDSGP